MPLQRANVPVALGGGLQQDADPRATPDGAFATLENVVYDRKGVARKRGGYASMSGPGGVVALAVDADALYAVAGASTGGTPARLHSYAPGPSAWRVVSDAHRVSPAVAPVVRSALGALNGFVAEVSGLRWELWQDLLFGVFYRALDLATGAVVVPATSAGTLFARLDVVVYCVCGTDIVIVESVDASAGANIAVRFLDTTTGVVATRGGGVIAGTASLNAQSIANYSATSFAVAYGNGTQAVVALVSTATTATLDSVAFGATNPVLRVAIGLFGAGLYALTYGGSAAGATHISGWLVGNAGSLAVTWGPVDLGDAGASANSGRLVLATRNNNDLLAGWQSGDDAHFRGVTAGGTAYATSSVVPFAPFGSQLFLQDGLVHGALFTAATYQTAGSLVPIATLVLACIDTGLTSAAAGSGPALVATLVRERVILPGVLPAAAVTQPDAARALVAADVLALGAVAVGGNNYGVDAVELDFAPNGFAASISANAAGLVAFAGGVLGETDGESYVEAGFVHVPDVLAVTHASAGSIPPGKYGYAACYGWLDACGNIHRSAPGFATVDSSGDGANRQHVVFLRCIALTRKAGVFLEVYRTQSNSSGPYYRLSAPMVTGLSNVPSAQTITFTTDVADAPLTALSFGTLYAPPDGSGELKNVAPPSAFFVLSHKNRLWLVSAEDRREIWYTKPLVYGHPPEFNAAQTIRLDDASEPITALASVDTNLVVFTAGRVYYVAGDGPNAAGAGGSFSDPQRVQSDAGCTDSRSLATLDAGVVYTSANGVSLLDRKLSTSFLGAGVKVDAAAYPVSLGVVVDPDRQRATLACATTARTAFRVLVFDYEKGLWTTWNVTGLAGAEPCRAQALWRGSHVLAGSGGVYLEASGAAPGHDPGPAWVGLTLETPWVQGGGSGGYQRVWAVVVTGRRFGACKLKIEAFTDYQDAADSSKTFDLTGASTALGLPVVRLEMGVVNQRCTALKVKITDLIGTAGVYGAENPTGFDLLSISLDVGLMPGRVRLPAGNKG